MQALGAQAGSALGSQAATGAASATAGSGFMDMIKLLQGGQKQQQPPAQNPTQATPGGDPSMTDDWLGFLSAGKTPSKQNMQNSQLLKMLNFGANGF